MNLKKLLTLVVVAILLIGIAVLTQRRREGGRGGARRIGAPVLAVLQDADTLNSVARMTFVSSGSTVEVARVDGAWIATGKHGYPAKFENVRDFALALVNLKVGQSVPVADSRLQRLGLLAPNDPRADEANAGTKVTLANEQGLALAELIVGNEFRGVEEDDSPMAGFGGMARGRYVFANGEAMIVSELFHGLPQRDQDWLDDDLVHVAGSDIAKISITRPEADPVVMRRSEDGGNLTLDPLPTGKEMDSAKVSGLSGLLSYLRFSDIADPALSDDELGLDKPAVYTAETRDGARYVLNIGAKAGDTDDRYARLSAVWTVEPAPDVAETDENDTDEAKREAEEVRKKKQAEIKALNERWSAWTYVLPSYKVRHGLTERDELVQDKTSKDKKEVPATEDGDKEQKKPGRLRRFFGRK